MIMWGNDISVIMVMLVAYSIWDPLLAIESDKM